MIYTKRVYLDIAGLRLKMHPKDSDFFLLTKKPAFVEITI